MMMIRIVQISMTEVIQLSVFSLSSLSAKNLLGVGYMAFVPKITTLLITKGDYLVTVNNHPRMRPLSRFN